MTQELLRPARLHERTALEELQLLASLMNPDDRAALLAHPDAIDLPEGQITGGNVYVCEDEGRIVGFGVVLSREDGQAELDGLFVRPEVWGEGYGRVLLEHGAAMAKSWGAERLHVVANPAAMGFYTACGFVADGVAQTRFKAATTMVKDLAVGYCRDVNFTIQMYWEPKPGMIELFLSPLTLKFPSADEARKAFRTVTERGDVPIHSLTLTSEDGLVSERWFQINGEWRERADR